MHSRTEVQCFAKTEEVLEMGMCGGPVLNYAGEVVGMIEGIVPDTYAELDGAVPDLPGCAAFIEFDELQAFVNDIERPHFKVHSPSL